MGAAGFGCPDDIRLSSGGLVQCQTVPVPVSFPDDLEVLMVSCGSGGKNGLG